MTRILALVLAVGVLAGCGASVQPAAEPNAPVTVTNCGKEVSYPLPQRAVSYDVSGTEKMFALGLADRMRGYVMNKLGDPAIAGSPWREDYTKVERLGTSRITREIVVNAKADWVLAGWGSGFSEERGITPQLLDQVGIRSYMHTETCFGYGDRKVDVPPLDALYADLENLGRIFKVEKRATDLVAELKGRVAKVRQSVPANVQPAKVFVYDSGTDQPFTAGKHAAPNDIISTAGGRNVMGDLAKGWATVGWEPVAQSAPDVIIIVDYADQPVADKKKFLESLPALQSAPAVQQDRYFVMSYGDAVSGPRNVKGAEDFAAYLRSVGR
nr:ABC transporter substrate-binding protein [Kibdelosporangium sp. MJ126-NF4]CEL22462.1 ABC transporter (iron.B12.siderophore.hemin), periplasmic substrate-binding component [Kibdelosporangium sp. MJ126-NF4]CTQ89318.1 ABC transporter (iron.B12.siderophore.hemin), periplasmic substrate-binding component [Kibdelosporangium sp. MJ126-NF4]